MSTTPTKNTFLFDSMIIPECPRTVESCTEPVQRSDGTTIRALLVGHEEHLVDLYNFYPALDGGHYTYDVDWI